jgi:hypothetical protein
MSERVVKMLESVDLLRPEDGDEEDGVEGWGECAGEEEDRVIRVLCRKLFQLFSSFRVTVADTAGWWRERTA